MSDNSRKRERQMDWKIVGRDGAKPLHRVRHRERESMREVEKTGRDKQTNKEMERGRQAQRERYRWRE